MSQGGRDRATRLIDRAEQSAAARAASVAVGVGLHPGYNAAQRLYAQRGYAPDGLGVTYEDRYVEAGELVRFDDELVLHLLKPLRSQSTSLSTASRLGAVAAAAGVLRSLERRGNAD